MSPKLLLNCWFALCAFSFSLPTAHAAVIIQRPLYIGLTNGLVGSWSFDGLDVAGNIAYDRSGNGANGTLTNGPVRVAGRIGHGLEFDGGNVFGKVRAMVH